MNPTGRRNGGPHPGALAIVALALTVAGVLIAIAASGGKPYPSPLSGSGNIVAYLGSRELARFLAALLFATATPLGILTATLNARLRRLGVLVPGPMIALYGGISGSVLLAISGLASWTATFPDVAASAPTEHALALVAFATGGAGFAGGLGLLVAGVAVPALILRLVPRWVSWLGLVIALVGELSFVSLFFDPANALLPLARFGGLIWLVAIGFLLPRDRREVSPRG